MTATNLAGAGAPPYHAPRYASSRDSRSRSWTCSSLGLAALIAQAFVSCTPTEAPTPTASPDVDGTRGEVVDIDPSGDDVDDAANADTGESSVDAMPPEDTIRPPGPAWPAPYPADNRLQGDDPRFFGQTLFLYDTWGAEVLGEWPPVEFLLDVLAAEPEVFGEQFSAFGFLPNPAADLPVGLARGVHDPNGTGETCAMCHVGRLPDGRMWYGAPNPDLDVRGLRRVLHERWTAAGNPPLVSSLDVAKSHAYGPGRTGADSSSYPTPVPADFPPYYRLGERTALNYLGTGRDLRTEVYFAIFTVGAGQPNDADAVVPFPDESHLRHLIDYMGTIDAPVGPSVDPSLRTRGEAVFASAGCSGCHFPGDPAAHGVIPVDAAPNGRERLPGEDPAWPRGSIRTSLAHRVLIDGDNETVDEGRGALLRFILARRLAVRNSDGYRSPPLEGVWSTAPYLHNGSVPTLSDLLRPASERPTRFERARGFVVDTTQPGNGNEGHEFGVALSDDDRDALIAYLQSL